MPHDFEQRGLGQPPYRVLRLNVHDARTAKCERCGRDLKREYIVESSDGRQFAVGSDCVKRSGDWQLIAAVEAESNRQRIEALKANLADQRIAAALATKPHPTPFYAQQGSTLLDYANFTMANGGLSAQLKLAAKVERIARETGGQPPA